MRGERIGYIAFCEKCLTVKPMDIFILVEYISKLRVKGFFCESEQCDHYNLIPDYMHSLVDELVTTLEQINEENKTAVPTFKKTSPFHPVKPIDTE